MASNLGSISGEDNRNLNVDGSCDHKCQEGFSKGGLVVPSSVGAGPTLPTTSEPGRTRTVLESLIPLTQLLVQEEVEASNFNRTFEIKANPSQNLFQAVETSNCPTNCRSNRSYEMRIFDSSGKEAIHLHRSLRDNNCSSLPRMEVFSPPDTLVGLIQVERSRCHSLLTIQDSKRETVLTIEGPCCISWFGSAVFRILTTESYLQVGRMSKGSTGWLRSGNSANYKINFPGDLDVKMKAVMIGACILVEDGIRPVNFWTGLLALVLLVCFIFSVMTGVFDFILIIFLILVLGMFVASFKSYCV